MIWIVTGKASYLITECNTHYRDGKYQLWVERTNNKSMKLIESEDKEEVDIVKEAIDYAVREGKRSLEL